jgi:hypothetical protein
MSRESISSRSQVKSPTLKGYEEGIMRKGKGALCFSCAVTCVAYIGGVLPDAQDARAEEAPVLHYSHATELTLREAPRADAAALARLPLNQPVWLLERGNGWCKVRLAEAQDSAHSGREAYVGCSFLREKKLDFAEIETEAARLFLELNRPGLDPADEARVLEQLFTRIERHFALSPSLYAYNDYRALLWGARQRGAKNPEIQLRVQEEKRTAMWRGLSRQTWERAFPVARRTVVTSGLVNKALEALEKLSTEYGLNSLPYSLPKYRPFIVSDDYGYETPEPLPADEASFFSRGKWVIGWAGGPMIRRRHGSHPPTYVVGFSNGGNEFLFNDLYEMIQALRVPVHASPVTIAILNIDHEEITMRGSGLTPILMETKLPVWAITAEGLVAGELRKAQLGPDDSGCFGSSGSAEFVFERPLKGRIYGVFASSAPIDPGMVKVTVGGKTSLTGGRLNAEEARLTYFDEASVDIDGDDVADLQVLLSTDHGANLDGGRLHHAVFNGNPGGFLRAGGYYDYNSYSLQVNEDGKWRTLFLYDLVTCT